MGVPQSIQDITNNDCIHISYTPPSTHEMLTPKDRVDNLNSKKKSHTLDVITNEQESPTLNICTHNLGMMDLEEDSYISCQSEISCEGISKTTHEEDLYISCESESSYKGISKENQGEEFYMDYKSSTPIEEALKSHISWDQTEDINQEVIPHMEDPITYKPGKAKLPMKKLSPLKIHNRVEKG
jgi:hypothetical protein